jgi:hypothetical protein
VPAAPIAEQPKVAKSAANDDASGTPSTKTRRHHSAIRRAATALISKAEKLAHRIKSKLLPKHEEAVVVTPVIAKVPAPVAPIAEKAPTPVMPTPAPAGVEPAAPSPSSPVVAQEAPPPPMADLTVRQVSGLSGSFRIVDAEYFLNGVNMFPARGTGDSVGGTRLLYDGKMRAGPQVFRVRMTVGGVATWPLVYLEDEKFVREVTRTFTAQENDVVSITAAATGDHNPLRAMSDNVDVAIKVDIRSAKIGSAAP